VRTTPDEAGNSIVADTPKQERSNMTTIVSERKAGTMTSIVITADNVYLPIAPGDNVVRAWPAASVSPSEVSRRTCLRVPAKLARFLCFRGQAEIVNTKAVEDMSSEAPVPSAEAPAKAAGA
jgi:hypothetical protein